MLNAAAHAYWQGQQKLSAVVEAAVTGGPRQFADAAAWQAHLAAVGVTTERHVRLATEGALLGSLQAHGIASDLVIVSDDAGQFDVLVHALCWVHQERLFAEMLPFSEAHRAAIAGVREGIWQLYRALKAYRQQPEPAQREALAVRFEVLVAGRTGFTGVDRTLKEMAAHRAELLRVLERPEVPLHNNGSESALRDYVKKRKISGSTRSEAGRRCRDTFATLKKTCRKLGVNFWEYVQDRVRGAGVVPRLAEQIRQQAAEVGPRLAVAASL